MQANKLWMTDEVIQELLAILPLLNRIVATEVRHEAGEETTMPQFRVLARLAAGPLTLSELARMRRVSVQAMGELVQVLVMRGWIVRIPDPNDRRQQALHLTDQGRERFERADEQVVRRLTPLLAALSVEELAAVQHALPAIHRVLTQAEQETSSGS